MREPISEEMLEDYVDGVLGEDDVAAVERHLERSKEARRTVAFLRSLKGRAAALPEAVEPGRDLWPGIAAALAPAPLVSVEARTEAASPPSAGAAATWWPRLRPVQWASLAAAAMLLMASSSALTAWLLRGPGGGASPATAAGAATVALDAAASPADYAVQIEELVWVLYENRESLDPDTVTTIETNLRVIDRAIRSAREALDEDPDNPGLARLLASNYEHKLELLQRAHRIIERS